MGRKVMKTVPEPAIREVQKETAPARDEVQGELDGQQEWYDPVFYYVDRVLVGLAAAFLLLTVFAQIYIKCIR
jgi:hypothetical protein